MRKITNRITALAAAGLFIAALAGTASAQMHQGSSGMMGMHGNTGQTRTQTQQAPCSINGAGGMMGGMGMMGGTMGMHGGMMNAAGMHTADPLPRAESLGLEDRQVQQLRTLREDFRKKLVQARADASKAAIDVQTARAEGDLSALEGALKEQAAQQVELQLLQARHQQDVKDVLTEEQIQKLDELRGQMHGQAGGMDGMHSTEEGMAGPGGSIHDAHHPPRDK
ncbi:MAG: hypothetical protein R6W82_01520 [bacterium]